MTAATLAAALLRLRRRTQRLARRRTRRCARAPAACLRVGHARHAPRLRVLGSAHGRQRGSRGGMRARALFCDGVLVVWTLPQLLAVQRA
jgi:hypothetical protein